MLKKKAGKKKSIEVRTEPATDGHGEGATFARTGSVRDLNGFLRVRGKRPVTIEEMNAAIVRGALKGNT